VSDKNDAFTLFFTSKSIEKHKVITQSGKIKKGKTGKKTGKQEIFISFSKFVMLGTYLTF